MKTVSVKIVRVVRDFMEFIGKVLLTEGKIMVVRYSDNSVHGIQEFVAIDEIDFTLKKDDIVRVSPDRIVFLENDEEIKQAIIDLLEYGEQSGWEEDIKKRLKKLKEPG